MAAAKKVTKYIDNRVIYNGTTTIVSGRTDVNPGSLIEEGKRLSDELLEFIFLCNRSSYLSKGVAKLHPNDVYDESLGIAVASKKAELAGNKSVAQDLRRLLKSVVKYEQVLNQSLEQLTDRANYIRDILKLKY